MKQIPIDLLQFENKQAILIATGTQTGTVFLARDGKLERIKFTRVPRPHYSDNEGFFVRNARVIGRIVSGIRLGSGSTREDKQKEEVRQLFLKDLEATLKNIEPVNQIYIFCPHYIQKDILGHIPLSLRDKIEKVYDGNYANNRDPLFLLKIIQGDREGKAESLRQNLVSGDAKKILERTNGIR